MHDGLPAYLLFDLVEACSPSLQLIALKLVADLVFFM